MVASTYKRIPSMTLKPRRRGALFPRGPAPSRDRAVFGLDPGWAVVSAERDLADFNSLRSTIITVLLEEAQSGAMPAHLMEEAVAAAEWGRIDPDRRFWAFGNAAGEVMGFDEAQESVHLAWQQLPDAVRDSLRTRVLDWVRR